MIPEQTQNDTEEQLTNKDMFYALLGKDKYFFCKQLATIYTFMIVNDGVELTTFREIITNKNHYELWHQIPINTSHIVSFGEIDFDALFQRSTKKLTEAIKERMKELSLD